MSSVSLRSQSSRLNMKWMIPGLLAGVAFLAETAVYAQPNQRGQLVVLGLLAPDGEDELANNATLALRLAGRLSNFVVPTDSPALEQSMAAFGCAEPNDDCLQQIAGDLHVERFIWGTLHRAASGGRRGPVVLEISLYETSTRHSRSIPPAEVARPSGPTANEAFNATARTAINTLLPEERRTDVVVGPGNRQPNIPVVVPPPPPPTPIRRYIGFAAIGLGGAAVVAGFATGGAWLGLAGEAGSNQMWLNYRPDLGDGGAVCDAARGDMNAPNVATDFCNRSGTLVAAQGVLIGLGAAIAIGGLVLVVTDNTPSSSQTATDGRRVQRRQGPAVTFYAVPIVSPTVQGGSFELRF